MTRRFALLSHRAVIAAGAALGTLVSVVWLRLDLGVSYLSGAGADLPSRVLDTGLTAALTGMVVVVASGLALRRRRRREHARTALD